MIYIGATYRIVLLTLMCVGLHMERNKHCDEPLLMWSKIMVGWVVFNILFDIYKNKKNYLTMGEQDIQIPECVKRINKIISVFSLVWFILTCVWFNRAKECDDTMPITYAMMKLYVVVNIILMCVPLVMCLLVCCSATFLMWASDQLPSNGAAQEDLNNLYSYTYHSPDIMRGDQKIMTISSQDAVCCVCMDEYVNDVELRLLGCVHHFHKMCCDRWLANNSTCPLCRKSTLDGGVIYSANHPIKVFNHGVKKITDNHNNIFVSSHYYIFALC